MSLIVHLTLLSFLELTFLRIPASVSFSHSFLRLHRDFLPPWILGSAHLTASRQTIRYSVVGVFTRDVQYFTQQKTIEFVTHVGSCSASLKGNMRLCLQIIEDTFSILPTLHLTNNVHPVWAFGVGLFLSSYLCRVVVSRYAPTGGEDLMLNCPREPRQ